MPIALFYKRLEKGIAFITVSSVLLEDKTHLIVRVDWGSLKDKHWMN
jgi:hypothetical protein